MHNTTTISDCVNICTLINTFVAKPQRQQGIIDSLRRFTLEAARQPGFVAASVHASLEGNIVVNYVQWQTRENLAAMLQTEAARQHIAEVAALAESVTPVFYRVAFGRSEADISWRDGSHGELIQWRSCHGSGRRRGRGLRAFAGAMTAAWTDENRAVASPSPS